MVLIPIICALPLYWRFMQCLRRYYDTRQRWPHLGNALKYALAHTIIIVSMFHPTFSDKNEGHWHWYRILWLMCYICTTLYTIVWDVTQDWGLFARSTKTTHGYFLRDVLVYKHPSVYYIGIIINFILRFVWCVTLIPYGISSKSHGASAEFTAGAAKSILGWLFSWDLMVLPALTLAELIRRFIWTLFRVEYEQTSHGTGFRYGEYIPVFFQHQAMADISSGNTDVNEQLQEPSMNVLVELIIMSIVLIVIAVIGAAL
jgi:hypothetical protein